MTSTGADSHMFVDVLATGSQFSREREALAAARYTGISLTAVQEPTSYV
jgi:hypothetical protein